LSREEKRRWQRESRLNKINVSISKEDQARRYYIMSADKASNSYEVLSPWAEADPIPLKGIAPRVTDLSGRKIGLLCNNKRAAPLILNAAERILKERFPRSETSWFRARSFSVSSLEPDNVAKFEEWINGVDVVVAAVGD
jgi:hypothetical protein